MLRHKEVVGKMDYRITFQEKVVGANESNEDEEEGWEDYVTVWASKTDRSGNESYRADKLTDYENTTFVCRYRTDITPKHRVVCDGVKYDILSIQEVGRRRFLSIETQSGGEYVEAAEVGEGIFDETFDESFE